MLVLSDCVYAGSGLVVQLGTDMKLKEIQNGQVMREVAF
jgi:hypothetical protein